MFTTPTVVGDRVFAGSCAGAFYALDRDRGVVLWRADVTQDSLPREFHGDPWVTGNLVITGTDGGEGTESYVYAFDRLTGDVRWKLPAGEGVTTDIAAFEQIGYALRKDDELVAFDLRTGQRAWSFMTGARSSESRSANPAVIGDRVVFAGRDWVVRALDARSGKPLWSFRCPAGIRTSLMVAGEEVLFAASDSLLYRLEARTGALAGRSPLPAMPAGAAALAERDSLVLFLGERTLCCYDLRAHRVRWSRDAPRSWSSSRPFVWGAVAVAGTEQGELFGFRLSDGLPQWTHRVTGTVRGLGAAGDTLFVGTYQGRLYALVPSRAAGTGSPKR